MSEIIAKLMSQKSFTEDLVNSFDSIITSEEPWAITVNALIAVPERMGNMYGVGGTIDKKEYLLAVSESVLNHCKADESKVWFNKLLVQRQQIVIVQTFINFPEKNHILNQLEPLSVILFTMFISLDFDSFVLLMPSLSDSMRTFLVKQLPFKKVYSNNKAKMLEKLYSHYGIVSEAVSCIAEVWSSKDFLENSPDKNYFLSLVLYYLLNPYITSDSTNHLFKGVQLRLTYNDLKVKNSAFLIASTLEDLLKAGENKHFHYKIEDFLSDVSFTESEEVLTSPPQTIKVYYLEDLIMKLKSNDITLFISALASASELILENLADLDLMHEDLLDVLLKINNTFNLENFDSLRKNAIVNLGLTRPEKTIELLSKALNNTETSVGLSIQILDFFSDISYILANPTIEKKAEARKTKPKTRYFRTYKPRSSPNYFNKHFEGMCAGIIQKLNGDIGDIIIIKSLHTISELLENTGNSRTPEISLQCAFLLRILNRYIEGHSQEITQACLVVLKYIPEKLQDSDYTEGLHEIVSKLPNSGNFSSHIDEVFLQMIDFPN